MRKNIETGQISAVLYGMDGIPLDTITSDRYIQAGAWDPEAFATGDYVLAIGPAVEPGETADAVLPGPSVGSTVSLEGRDYTENVDSSLPVTSRQTMARQYEEETRSAAVMGNAISLIIALVGVLNFVNSMVTAIVSRKREFAMIQSVGMTKRQLRKMLVSEGLFYAGITLLVSVTVSSAAICTVIRWMTEGGYSTWHFTLLPLAFCAPLLLLFAVLVPWLCFRNLEKQSIVERLRME